MGVLRRAAPAPSARPISKPSRGTAPSARGATALEPASTIRVAGASQKLSSVPSRPKYAKAVRNGVVVEMEVIPVACGAETLPDASTFLKPAGRGATAPKSSAHRASAAQKLPAPPSSKCANKAIATCGPMAREKPARRAGADEQFPVPSPKRAETSSVEVEPAVSTLRKRMASELEALRDLLKKAELICRGPACKGGAAPAAEPPRPEAGGSKTPAAKRRKVSPLPEKASRRMSLDEKKQIAGRMASLATVPDQIVEFLQKRLGGDADEIEIDFDSAEDSVLLELQALLDKLAAEERPTEDAVVHKEEQGSVAMEVDSKTQMDSNDHAEEAIIPVQDEGDVDICGASDSDSDSSSSSSDSGGSSSSSSDSDGSSSSSDSSSDSDSDDEVEGPAPPAVLPDQNATSSQPPPEL